MFEFIVLNAVAPPGLKEGKLSVKLVISVDVGPMVAEYPTTRIVVALAKVDAPTSSAADARILRSVVISLIFKPLSPY